MPIAERLHKRDQLLTAEELPLAAVRQRSQSKGDPVAKRVIRNPQDLDEHTSGVKVMA